MPDRPQPVTLPGILSDHAARIRAVERMATPPDAKVIVPGECMEMPGEGTPDEPYRMQPQIDPSILNQLGCTDLGLFVGSGQQVGWDALVDGTIVASDPDARLFKGIGEALTYLANVVGLTACVVAVRPWASPAAGLGYVETADWTMPLQTRLFGLRGVAPPTNSVLETDGFAWTIDNFMGRTPAGGTPNLRIENCIELDVTQTTAGLRFGTVWMYDTHLDLRSGGHYFCGSFYGISCTFDFVLTEPKLAQFRAQIMLSDIGRIGTGIIAGTSLEVIGSVFGGGVITLPAFFYIDSYVNTSFRAPGFPGPPSFVVPSGAGGYIRMLTSSGAQVTATSSFANLVLEGGFNNLTLTGAHTTLRINADNASGAGLWNISGPADINAVISGTTRLQLRGEGISGTIAADSLTGSNTLLDFIGCDRSSLVVAADPTGSTRKSYAFDASSDRNVLVFHGLDSGWTAGTDAGTNNRVLPEGAAPPAAGFAPADATYLVTTADATLTNEVPVGLTPNGELGGTWAAITVDATHSGSAHSDFIAKAFFAAKGDLIGASANDTPIILTVGTNNFVLVADSSTASGLAWKNVTTLLNPTAGWGSITNVTPDKVYDANATTVDELADVLGTLIANLVSQGVLAT